MYRALRLWAENSKQGYPQGLERRTPGPFVETLEQNMRGTGAQERYWRPIVLGLMGTALLAVLSPVPGSRLQAQGIPGLELDIPAPQGCLLYTSPSPRDQRG